LNRSLHRFALFTALATLALVGVGGLVTSHGVGMAVPDWPNSYGYNMFFFPVSRWVGGIFYEHTHRLLASAVGVLTSVLALWLYGRSARPFMRWTGLVLMAAGVVTCLAVWRRWTDGAVLAAVGAALLGASLVWPRCESSPKWLRRLGVAAFLAVVLQGVLGGLRVVLFKDQIGIFHAALAQIFFVLLCAIALFTSQWRQAWQISNLEFEISNRLPATLLLSTTALIFGQLVLGATMRHQHAGLAIPDFPLAYGKLWPAVDSASVALYNQHRMEITSVNPITGNQILLQMAHRMTAVVILVAVGFCARAIRRRLGPDNLLSRLGLAWLGLIIAQAVLGAATIWSGKAADIATAHVMLGALSLAFGVILSIIAFGERTVPAGVSKLGLRESAPSKGQTVIFGTSTGEFSA
jgi:cytochrome c oxidase assembly protein subunit 15